MFEEDRTGALHALAYGERLNIFIYFDRHSILSYDIGNKIVLNELSRLMGKTTICICENKDADQLRGNREADQHLCFCYTDSTLPLLFKSKISSFQPASVTVQPVLCRTCSETTLLVFPRGGSICALQGHVCSLAIS